MQSSIKHTHIYDDSEHGRPQGGARGSGRSPLENKKKKKKKLEKKMYKQNFLTCKRPPSYVMRRNFLTKGPHVMH